MKAGWEEKTLDQISINLDSRRIPITKAVRTSGEYPYYGASGIVDYVADYIFDEDTLLVSEDGANLLARTTPIAFPASGKYWVNNHAHILKFENITTQRFVELYLESIPLDSYITGAAQPKLNQKALNSIPIPLPPLPEQQRIVGILDEAFEGIATAKANVEKNLQNSRALFESYLQAVFTQRGTGWVEKPLGTFCSFENGDRGTNYPSKSARTATGIPFVNAGHLTDDGINFENMDYISRERFDLLSNGKIRKGDILFCLRGSLGKFSSVGGLSEGAIASSLVIVRPEQAVLNEFVLAYFRSPLCSEMINRFKNGAAQPNLSAQSLRKFIVPVPPLPEQESVVGRLTQLRTETQRLESLYQRKLAALDTLKKSLLHQAFSGQL